MQGRSDGCRKPWQVRWLRQCAPESDYNDVEHEEALVGHEHTQDSNLLRARCWVSKVCRHHGGTEWYHRAEDDVLQKQSDSTPSGGVGEHAVGSSGGRGGAERGERTGDMSDMRPASKSLFEL